MNTTLLEENVTFTMVDFFKEADYIISLGLARQKTDVNTIKWYRITAENPKLISPKNGLLLKHAYIDCQGRLLDLGCDGHLDVTNPLLPAPEGHFMIGMKGVLDATSKCLVTCQCDTQYMIYADASAGKPGECYLVVANLRQKEALLPVTPFLEMESVAVVSFN